MTKMPRRLFRDAHGAKVVEMALVSTLLFTITFGTVEFGRMVLDYHVVSTAAEEGVRYAVVRGSSSGRAASAGEIATYVAGRSTGLLSPANVIVTWPTNNAPGSVVQVRVEYSFSPIVTLLPDTGVTLTSTTRGNIVR